MSGAALGRCTLTTTRVAALERRPVHLADRAGRQRRRARSTRRRPPRARRAPRSIDRDDLGLGERRHAVLERRELLDELRRQQVGPRREDLAELGERRPELLERLAQARRACARRTRRRRRRRAELAEPVLASTRPICAARPRSWPSTSAGSARSPLAHVPPEEPAEPAARPPSRLAGRVHDDDRAAGVVRDAVGHVAEQELLAAAHADVADDDHVGALLLGGLDDRGRGVVVDDHPRLPSLARKLCAYISRSLAAYETCVASAAGPLAWLGHDHLEDEQLGLVASGHVGRPSARRARRSPSGRWRRGLAKGLVRLHRSWRDSARERAEVEGGSVHLRA